MGGVWEEEEGEEEEEEEEVVVDGERCGGSDCVRFVSVAGSKGRQIQL